MKLPKYKQPIYNRYMNTDFNDLTNEEKEVFDNIFLSCLKSSYCMTTVVENKYYNDNINIVKSLINKGLIEKHGGLLLVPMIMEMLNKK